MQRMARSRIAALTFAIVAALGIAVLCLARFPGTSHAFTASASDTNAVGLTSTETPGALDTLIPSPTPLPGEIRDVLAINLASCESLAPWIAEVGEPICSLWWEQTRLQQYVRCSRSQDVNGDHVRDCDLPTLDPPPGPADFEPIDLDLNEVHQGQQLIILAFLDATGPVQFASDKGKFFGESNVRVCNTGSQLLSMGDPDCGNPQFNEVPDGVVVSMLEIGADTPRGPGQISVTQGSSTKTLDFLVTGPPVRLSFENIDGRTELVANSPDCLFPRTIDGIRDIATNGVGEDPHKTALIIRAYDSDGLSVAGANLYTGVESDLKVIPGVGNLASLDLGTAGVGSPQIACGYAATGLGRLLVYAAPSNDELSNQPRIAIPFNVISSPSTATPTETPSPTATSTPTDTPTNTSTPTPTDTLTPTTTPTDSPTKTPTATPSPTATSTPSRKAISVITRVRDLICARFGASSRPCRALNGVLIRLLGPHH